MVHRAKAAARLSLIAVVLLGAECPGASSVPEAASAGSQKKTQQACDEPRPEVCAQVYDPVCAQRDTGIRCVTTPCDSTEAREYPNACDACRDPWVLSYVKGPCEDEAEDEDDPPSRYPTK